MAVPFSNTKLRVPKGFQNILEGLAREVLRNQPENIYEFGSKYFEQLLAVRDGKTKSNYDYLLILISNFEAKRILVLPM